MVSSVDCCSHVADQLYSNPPIVYEACNSTVVQTPLTIETLGLIRDSFPSYGCSVMTFDKSSTKDPEWVQSYAIIKGKHIYLTTDEKDQIPWKSLPLDQITFHMNENENNHTRNSDDLGADHDYSQFEIQVVTKRMIANRDSGEVRLYKVRSIRSMI